jgi:dipeptidase D
MKPTGYPQEPKYIWDRFYDITQIPHPSKKEDKIIEYLIGFAKEHNFEYKMDDEKNVVIYVPGTEGYEDHDAVIIQSHMDMVTVKTNDKEHNFDTDSLDLVVEDGWLKADRTTLGADNGLGIAAALAAAEDKSVKHPPLEILCTTDEETGLNGATNLDASMLSGKKMLNLDTEDWGEIYIGCAGGLGYEMKRNYEKTSAKESFKGYSLVIEGLAGGHSGVQIHEQNGNALKLLAELLNDLSDLDIQLNSVKGGVAHNVIAREAEAIIFTDKANEAEINSRIEKAKERWLGILPKADHEIEIKLGQKETDNDVLNNEDYLNLLDFMTLFPHGAASYNLNQPADLVDLSSNFSVLQVENGLIKVIMSLRFFNREEAISMDQKIHALGRTFGLSMEKILDYPSWKPEFDNPLLDFSLNVYEENFGEKPKIKAIHAGLECGIIKSKKTDIDIVSFGPTILGAHSPTERVEIETVDGFWKLFVKLLEKL